MALCEPTRRGWLRLKAVRLTDKAELRAYLQRLLAWARKLPPSQNSFKVLVIGNLLKLDMSEAKYDRVLFIEYLGLPRNAFYYDLASIQECCAAAGGTWLCDESTSYVTGDR